MALVEIGRATEIDGTHPTRTKRDLLVEYAEHVRVESDEFMNLTGKGNLDLDFVGLTRDVAGNGDLSLKGRDFLRTYLASQ